MSWMAYPLLVAALARVNAAFTLPSRTGKMLFASAAIYLTV